MTGRTCTLSLDGRTLTGPADQPLIDFLAADTPLLYTERFHTDDGRATLHPLEWKPPAEAPDGEYDLALDNGRMLEHA